MANKQKIQKSVRRKYQDEKNPRSVSIIKHFQPNVSFNKLHLNCDLPEVNADIDFIQTSKNNSTAPSQARTIEISSIKKLNVSSINEKTGRKSINVHITPLLPSPRNISRFKSNTKYSLSSGSSTTKESTPLKSNTLTSIEPKVNSNKRNNLKKSLVKSSLTADSTVTKENDPSKAKMCYSNKSKSFSVGNRKKDDIPFKFKAKKLADSSDSNKTVNDLKREIEVNRLRKSNISKSDNSFNKNSRRERVESLRNEIRKLIDVNLDDKRKHLTELTTEIAEFRANNELLVYNVELQNEGNTKKPDEEIIETALGENMEEPEVIVMKSCEKFCGLPKEALDVDKSDLLPPDHDPDSREKVDNESDRPLIQIEVDQKKCLNHLLSEDIVKSKIKQTNLLIEQLQKTLNEIKKRTKTPETEQKIIQDGNENAKPDYVIEKLHYSDPLDADTQTENTMSQPAAVAPYRSSPKESAREMIVNDENDVVISRPKTRRCKCLENAVEAMDKFQTIPKQVEDALDLEDTDEFGILQAKLDTIDEPTESEDFSNASATGSKTKSDDVLLASEPEPDIEELKETKVAVSSSSTNTMIKEATTLPSTPCSGRIEKPTSVTASQTENRTELVQSSTENFEIPQLTNNKPKLSVQVLPAISIATQPTIQKVFNFSIDQSGATHVDYINIGFNVGFFEVRAASIVKLYSSSRTEAPSLVVQKEIEEIPSAEGKPSRFNYFDRSKMKISMHVNKVNRDKHRSVSDSEIVLSKIDSRLTSSNTPPEDSCSPDYLERKRVLQSYQLLDNKNLHDPGELSAHSLDMISAIDEQVYKTYINPEGFSVLPFTPSAMVTAVPSSHKPKSIFEAFASKKTPKKGFDTDMQNQRGVTEECEISATQMKSQSSEEGIETSSGLAKQDRNEYKAETSEDALKLRSPQAEFDQSSGAPKLRSRDDISDNTKELRIPDAGASGAAKLRSLEAGADTSCGAPKLYNIGLYTSKSTQMSPLGEDVEETILTPLASTSDTKSSSSYEKISLTISYSTEESIKTEPSANLLPSASKQKQKLRIQEEMTDTGSESSIKPKAYYQKCKSLSFPGGSAELRTFKNLREKITKQYAIDVQTSKTDKLGESSESEEQDDKISFIAVPNFISGLLTSETDELKKVIPQIRRSVREAKSEIRQSLMGLKRSSRQKSMVSDDEQGEEEEEGEVKTADFDVLTVQVQGDCCLEMPATALQIGKNGRYKDEEDLFCESSLPRYGGDLLQQRFGWALGGGTTRNGLESSNSDTMASCSERMASEGEVKCECSVSIGELHACVRRTGLSNRFRRRKSFVKEEAAAGAGVRKRRTYFNNWVSYYVDKNALSMRDSSSMSQ